MFQRSYAIKKGYQPQLNTHSAVDTSSRIVTEQSSVCELAVFLANRGHFKYVITIGGLAAEKLQGLNPDIKVVAVGRAQNLVALQKTLPNVEVIDCDLEKGLSTIKIPESVLREAVVLSVDVIEHLREPHQYLKGLSRYATIAPYVLIATPDRTRIRGPEDFGPPSDETVVREWAIDELYLLLKDYGVTCKIGYTTDGTPNDLKTTSLAIAGTQAVPPQNLIADKSALAIMCAYNEADIIQQSIGHLLRQGVAVHVVENWSNDGTAEIVKKLALEHKDVTYEHFPKVKPKKHEYQWLKLLKRVEEIAETDNHDWIIHNDADEFRQSPWAGVTIRQALSFVSRCGYNAIDFSVVDFRPTRDGYDGSVPPEEFFYYFEFVPFGSYQLQIKGWQYPGRVDLASSAGHSVEFPDRKVFPLKFTSRHYPLRSKKQAKTKIFKDRVYVAEEREMGWHIQYDQFSEDDPFLWNPDFLRKATPSSLQTEYMVELISSVGVKADKRK